MDSAPLVGAQLAAPNVCGTRNTKGAAVRPFDQLRAGTLTAGKTAPLQCSRRVPLPSRPGGPQEGSRWREPPVKRFNNYYRPGRGGGSPAPLPGRKSMDEAACGPVARATGYRASALPGLPARNASHGANAARRHRRAPARAVPSLSRRRLPPRSRNRPHSNPKNNRPGCASRPEDSKNAAEQARCKASHATTCLQFVLFPAPPQCYVVSDVGHWDGLGLFRCCPGKFVVNFLSEHCAEHSVH